MPKIQITSSQDPFGSRQIARLAVGLIATAEAMGLLDRMEIRRLDLPTFRRIVDRIAAAGIGTEVQAALSTPASGPGAEEGMRELLARLSVAIEESPVPAHEWPALSRLFGAERLAQLVGVSPASVRRYETGSRSTPDQIAARLHFLATLVGDLAGAYNEIGIRRWFGRPRSPLDGKAPDEILNGDWDPDDPAVRQIRELARSLGASNAT